MFFFKNQSRAFQRGFSDGVTSAFRVIAGERVHFSYSANATDAEAWRKVGGLLNQSYREVGSELVKNPRKTPPTRKRQHA